MGGDLILSEQTTARAQKAFAKKRCSHEKNADRPKKPVRNSESESESESECQCKDDSLKRPAVRWAADNERLVWKPLELLKQHDMLRKASWKGPNETTRRAGKIGASKQLAIFLVSDESPYKEAIAAAKEEEGQREYNRIL
ncbi:hypothetical protein FN846DRAFT_891363 [Sphaerosporella brunnea]|uniref:Uncharacterized protein n=1 Tax=Sphaerosporella brunnea TaxID=1250544 RepID=A0A5J5ET39_9PEZI|nr:hypothetical protein FN846DRAFT_1026155 [Sphaerosporella brunnea]KAA8902840.1 hypothetical protein FN846DRAFT_891363 [Sphaerosporella brunnea]